MPSRAARARVDLPIPNCNNHAPAARRERKETSEERLLPWHTINQLVREAKAKDPVLLSSFLRWSPNERHALATIEALRKTCPIIWIKRVTPFQPHEEKMR
jgi:hypothetical protein